MSTLVEDSLTYLKHLLSNLPGTVPSTGNIYDFQGFLLDPRLHSTMCWKSCLLLRMLWQGHWQIRRLGLYRLVSTFLSFSRFSTDSIRIYHSPPFLRLPPLTQEAPPLQHIALNPLIKDQVLLLLSQCSFATSCCHVINHWDGVMDSQLQGMIWCDINSKQLCNMLLITC
jgi:hypothetical protein